MQILTLGPADRIHGALLGRLKFLCLPGLQITRSDLGTGRSVNQERKEANRISVPALGDTIMNQKLQKTKTNIKKREKRKKEDQKAAHCWIYQMELIPRSQSLLIISFPTPAQLASTQTRNYQAPTYSRISASKRSTVDTAYYHPLSASQ
ncbi:hypothetical protein BDW66DRAFT_63384 [Aspergillus desertorum]